MSGAARRALVTGATGFVGSHVAEALAAAGWRLRCSLRATSPTRWIEGLEAERLELDLSGPSEAALEAALSGAEAVVHVAGITRAREEAAYVRINAEATERLARAAAAAGVRRFVLVSSLAARGPDGADGPVSAYGRSKREAEARLREASPGGAGMEAVALRPGGVYGPRDKELLPLFRVAARGWLPAPAGGAPLQPVYATDVATACLRAVETAAPGFGPWPVVGAGRHGWAQVAAALEGALGRRVRRVRLPPGLFEAAAGASERIARALGRPPLLDRRRARDLSRHAWTADPTPTEAALGWRPEVGLAEGLARTARWYREAGWLPA